MPQSGSVFGANQQPAVVASPDYLARYPMPKVPADIYQHRCIGYWLTSANNIYKWEFERDEEKVEIAVDAAMVFNESHMMVDAALEGVGLAYVFEGQVTKHIADGTLVRVLDDWCHPFTGFFLYYPSRRQTPAALVALINALRVASPSCLD